MKKTFLLLVATTLIAAGCSNNNKANTSDNSSANPPAGGASSSGSSGSASSSTASTSSSNPDQDFISNAAKGNRAEVELGRMVATKAKDPSVKQFAQMMVKDHSQAMTQLQQLAQKKSITLPEDLPSDAKDLQSKLSGESGKQFDKDYMDGMVQDHQKDVQEFQQASQSAIDPDVKQWATKMVPKLQQHLQKAESIDSKMGGGPGSSSSSPDKSQ